MLGKTSLQRDYLVPREVELEQLLPGGPR